MSERQRDDGTKFHNSAEADIQRRLAQHDLRIAAEIGAEEGDQQLTDRVAELEEGIRLIRVEARNRSQMGEQELTGVLVVIERRASSLLGDPDDAPSN